ncbi:TauD/TfdA family dioxygenase [Actinoplanes sp. N902-109]|uniref:TauD/TfdA family dioxygenase n=1 Tax=Actinoplanes sp. (strain N902-109) TaxID=649831 RepID=UPI000329660D|nr:TauD/TfdA family dioxygenase [Actinoplanes sp. N902-109]AGL18131.1 oxygenase (secreted protein) [Actinoplanes sp. N902-109]
MTTQTFAEIDIPDHARDRMSAELVELPDPSHDADWTMTRLHQVFAGLPVEQLRAILDFGRHVDTPGVALVRNLPTDPQLPPTPASGGPAEDKKTFVAEGVLLGLSGLLGEPVGIVSEKAGRLVHDVVPVQQGATTQTNMGSKVFLNFHNDIVHDSIGRYDVSNPDFLVLSCLRQDPAQEAVTSYADARDVIAALPSGTVEVLRSPLFQLNAPGNYCRDYAGGEPVWADPMPIISGPAAYPEIAVSANGVKALTTTAEDAFEQLQRACREVAHQVRLAPGTALLINNRKGLHARSQFRANYDGNDRWLQRTYVRRSLWTLRYRLSEQERRVMA